MGRGGGVKGGREGDREGVREGARERDRERDLDGDRDGVKTKSEGGVEGLDGGDCCEGVKGGRDPSKRRSGVETEGKIGGSRVLRRTGAVATEARAAMSKRGAVSITAK